MGILLEVPGDACYAVPQCYPMEVNMSHESNTLPEALREHFGFEAFRPGQEAVISRLMAGKSSLAIFPTGGGKSICYQLPSVLLDGLTLVISPLIALMKDQLDFLMSHGAPAARLDSSLSREETLQIYDDLRDRRLKLLYISPERLGNERFLHTLRRQKIALLAVDEAHCISEWGHNFRPDYLKIARLAQDLGVERVLALTATATPQVAHDIEKGLLIDASDTINTGFYRPNLNLQVTPCSAAERRNLLLEKMRQRPPGPTIVYVTLQRTAERAAEFLSEAGLNARAYHAGMDSEERHAIQDSFMASDNAIIVATIAFGMGVDKANIRYVYHYNLPKGLESYCQEIGRAGRDGEPAICELLACNDDVTILENFSYGDTPDATAVVSIVEEALSQGDIFDISTYDLSGKHDIRPLVVKTLLTYLELKNVLISTGPFYSGYKFKPLRSSQEIFERVGPERADFLRKIFRHAKKGKTWFTLDAEEIGRAIGETRDRIVSALGYLEEVGDFELQASGVRLGYRIDQRPADTDALCKELIQQFQTREDNDIKRIRRILAYAEHDGCLTRHLLDYFGEQRDDCGHCSRCDGVTAQKLPAPDTDEAKSHPIDALRLLKVKNSAALTTPRQIARFLCGLSSPASTRAKLRGNPLYGIRESTPFHTVLNQVEEAQDTL